MRPVSVAWLSAFVLSFVLALYLLRIKRKSADTWVILQFIGVSSVLYLLSVFYYSRSDHYEQTSFTFWSYQVVLIVQQLIVLKLAYELKGNPFPKELKYVSTCLVVIIIPTLIARYITGFQWNWPFYLLFNGLAVIVLLRKATTLHTDQLTTDGKSSPQKTVHLIEVFQRPANRNTKALVTFALWMFVSFLMWGIINIMLLGVMSFETMFPIQNTLLLIQLIWLMIIYSKYANEHTTFVAKLVGLSLCPTLMLLGIIPFLLRLDQHNLKVFALLIVISTIIIVSFFPVFFRRNLLRPLNEVLIGVQAVNEGNLQVNVPVEVKDEIGRLAQHFNSMTDSLRSYSLEMENLVAQRTHDLERSLKELKAAQSQLIQSEKMASLGELTAGIAHEIQNPLNFVNNFSDVNSELIEELKSELIADNKDDALAIANDIKENEQKINHHGKRADAIVKGMLEHSRAGSGKKEWTDINALVDEYLRLSYHGLRAKDKSFNADFKTEFDKSIGKVEVVPQDIGRVLLNLINNAFYSVNEKKRQLNATFEPVVTVTTKRIGDKVEILVKDNGYGIPAKVVDKIFQPFFTTKPTGQGTGLGLSLSYDIIKSNGGEMKVESKEGEGAEFIIQLLISDNIKSNKFLNPINHGSDNL
jgi:signal transduction histidine kinase